MSFQPSVVIQPQFVGNSAAALTLTTTIAGVTAPAVPALNQIYVGTCRFVNVTSGAVTLKVWRVNSGGANNDQHVAVETVTVPVATATNPWFEWSPGAYLSPGDAIWAIAGSASAITVSGDGALITP